MEGIVKYLPKHVLCVAVICVATPCVTMPCVVHGKFHEMCMFHTTRKRGPCEHMTEVHCSFLMAPHIDMRVEVKLKLSNAVPLLSFDIPMSCII